MPVDIKFRAAVVVLFAGAAAAGATPAASAASCGPRDIVAGRLAAEYKEHRRAVGAMRDRMVEVFVAASGSWSVLMTAPDGTACMVASGEAWEFLAAPDGDGA